MGVETLLKNVPILAQLDDVHLKQLVTLAKIHSLEAGTSIFNEGDYADSMYVIITGSVRIYKQLEDGVEEDLSVLHEGDVFGEWALLDNQPRSASAITLTTCALFTIEQSAFMSVILESRENVFPLLSWLVKRMRETNEHFFQSKIALHRLADKMEIERLRALSQMVTGVAHEINTPLGTINTAASILQRIFSSTVFARSLSDRPTQSMLEDGREALGLIQRNVQRANRLIQDFKKVSAGQLSGKKEHFDLVAGLYEIINLASLDTRKAKIEIQVVNRLSVPETKWFGYYGYLSQIILNLLTNILRYAYPDGKGGIVEITVAADSVKLIPHFILTVRDFGVGITPENLPKVFEPFFTTGRIMGGAGLGLAIVHNIVTSVFKGTIDITSTLGQGTTVQITFPQEILD